MRNDNWWYTHGWNSAEVFLMGGGDVNAERPPSDENEAYDNGFMDHLAAERKYRTDSARLKDARFVFETVSKDPSLIEPGNVKWALGVALEFASITPPGHMKYPS